MKSKKLFLSIGIILITSSIHLVRAEETTSPTDSDAAGGAPTTATGHAAYNKKLNDAIRALKADPEVQEIVARKANPTPQDYIDAANLAGKTDLVDAVESASSPESSEVDSAGEFAGVNYNTNREGGNETSGSGGPDAGMRTVSKYSGSTITDESTAEENAEFVKGLKTAGAKAKMNRTDDRESVNYASETSESTDPCKVGSHANKKLRCKSTNTYIKAGTIGDAAIGGAGQFAVQHQANRAVQQAVQGGSSQTALLKGGAQSAETASQVSGVKGAFNAVMAVMNWSNYAKHKKNSKKLMKETQGDSSALFNNVTNKAIGQDGEGTENPTSEDPENNKAANGMITARNKNFSSDIVNNYKLNSRYSVEGTCAESASVKAAVARIQSRTGSVQDSALVTNCNKRVSSYLGKRNGMREDVTKIGRKAAYEQDAAAQRALGSAIKHTAQTIADGIQYKASKDLAKTLNDNANQLQQAFDDTPSNDDVFARDPLAPGDPNNGTSGTGIEPPTTTDSGLTDRSLASDDKEEEETVPEPPALGNVGGEQADSEGQLLPPGEFQKGGGNGVPGGGGGGAGNSVASTGQNSEGAAGAPQDPAFAGNTSENGSGFYRRGGARGRRGGGGGGAESSGFDLEGMMSKFLPGGAKKEEGHENSILNFGGRDVADDGSGRQVDSLLAHGADLFDTIHDAYQKAQKSQRVGLTR